MTAGKSIFDEVTAKSKHRRTESSWIVQAVLPRDQFETCTLTVEQWLANTESGGFQLGGKAEKWRAIMEACALVLPGIARQGGLRQEPRVGFDPIGDQPYFVFKASNSGTTFFVSPQGLRFEEDEIYNDLTPAPVKPPAP